MRLFVLAATLLLLGLPSSHAQNTMNDYSAVQQKMENLVTLVAGSTSGYKISESRIERDGSSYTRNFVNQYKYMLVAYAPSEASQVRLTVTCNGSQPMSKTKRGNNVTLIVQVPATRSCRVKSEVVDSTRPDLQHFVGTMVLFKRP